MKAKDKDRSFKKDRTIAVRLPNKVIEILEGQAIQREYFQDKEGEGSVNQYIKALINFHVFPAYIQYFLKNKVKIAVKQKDYIQALVINKDIEDVGLFMQIEQAEEKLKNCKEVLKKSKLKFDSMVEQYKKEIDKELITITKQGR